MNYRLLRRYTKKKRRRNKKVRFLCVKMACVTPLRVLRHFLIIIKVFLMRYRVTA